jgi:hypothetical protein
MIRVFGEGFERESPRVFGGAGLKGGPCALIGRFTRRGVGSGILGHQRLELMGLAVQQILSRSGSPIFFNSRGLFVDKLTIDR